MADFKKYKVGITVKEPWADNISYEQLDMTLFAVENGGDGCAYVALKPNIGVRPNQDATTWIKATQRGQSIYDYCIEYELFVGTEEEFAQDYADAVQAAKDAAASATHVEEEVSAAEQGRVSAENARVSAESQRASAEDSRVSSEAQRSVNETGRVNAEDSRVAAENARVVAENQRASAESTRATNEENRMAEFGGMMRDAETAIGLVDVAMTEAENVDATVDGMIVTITDRHGVSKSVNIGFDIYKTYGSVAAMNADAANVEDGKFVMIATLDPTSTENAQLWVRNSNAATSQNPFTFLSDLDQASSAAWADWMENQKPIIEADHTTAVADHTQAVADHTNATNDHAVAGQDHTTAGTDHTQAVSDSTRAGQDHLVAEQDHTRAEGDHTTASTDHTTAQSDHTTAHNDNVTAEVDHQTAVTDHGTATIDHTTASSDHTTAQSDHAAATNDHQTATTDHQTTVSDHNIADGDHTLASADHTAAVADHTQAASDHTRAENDNATATSDHTLAASDHTTATEDHTQAVSDHTTAAADHATAVNDHAAVEVYVDSLGAFDLSKYNAVGGVLATYADLSTALTALNALDSQYKYGGMSFKFVQTSDQKYIQYRYMSSSTAADDFTNVANWQGVDDEPTTGSNNLVKSGGVHAELEKKANIDGYYESMGVGTADNLTGQTERTDDAMYRKSGGSEEVVTGTAEITNIKGNTVAWNQLLNEGKLVDMGLPSGTLWATCNIDVTRPDGFAASPYQYECSFFSWGNINGHNPISESAFDYNWGGINGQEPWYDGQPYGDTQGNTLTGHIPVGETYDAARVNVGSLWRMPTNAEYGELFANIRYINADGTEVDTTNTDKRVTVNGVLGLYLESTINGARLFFPCSGLGLNNSWNYRGMYGYYWASTWASSRSSRNLYFSTTTFPQDVNYRYYGYAVRPVITKYDLIDNGKNGHKYALSSNNANITDVTLTYGSNNEPSTVAQFEADYFKWFGKPLTYEAYDEGSLRSVQLDSLKTVGFNQWDERWEVGGLTRDMPNNRIRSKNYIKVLPNTNYYIESPELVNIAIYDLDKNWLGYGSNHIYNAPNYIKKVVFNTGDDAHYIKLNTGGDYGTTYNHDICINISDTSRNGEYEPYEEHSVSLPVTTITGKLNGQGESVVVFPDGMKSAGSVYDEIYTVGDKTYAVKRIGSMDMGTLSWGYTDNRFRSTADFNVRNVSRRIPAVSSKYPVLYKGEDYPSSSSTVAYFAGLKLWLCDPTLNETSLDSNNRLSTLSGVMLYYELATPQVYELDTFDLPKPYQVDNNGTEEQIQKSGVQGLAAILTCIYGVDAVGVLDKLPRNYISENSMDNFLAQLNTVTGGVWTKTWNDNTGEWDFSFTPNA